MQGKRVSTLSLSIPPQGGRTDSAGSSSSSQSTGGNGRQQQQNSYVALRQQQQQYQQYGDARRPSGLSAASASASSAQRHDTNATDAYTNDGANGYFADGDNTSPYQMDPSSQSNRLPSAGSVSQFSQQTQPSSNGAALFQSRVVQRPRHYTDLKRAQTLPSAREPHTPLSAPPGVGPDGMRSPRSALNVLPSPSPAHTASTHVRVVVRMRPLSEREKGTSLYCCIEAILRCS